MKQAKKITIGVLAAGAALAVLAASPAAAGSYTYSSRVNNATTTYGGNAYNSNSGPTTYGDSSSNGANDFHNSRWGNQGVNTNTNDGVGDPMNHVATYGGGGGCDTGCGTPPPPPPPAEDCGCDGHDHGGGKGKWGKGKGKWGHGGGGGSNDNENNNENSNENANNNNNNNNNENTNNNNNNNENTNNNSNVNNNQNNNNINIEVNVNGGGEGGGNTNINVEAQAQAAADAHAIVQAQLQAYANANAQAQANAEAQSAATAHANANAASDSASDAGGGGFSRGSNSGFGVTVTGGGGGAYFGGGGGGSMSMGGLNVVVREEVVVKPVKGICVNPKGLEERARMSTGSRDIGPGEDVEIFHCMAGDMLVVTIGRLAGSDGQRVADYTGGYVIECREGEALRQGSNGMLACAPFRGRYGSDNAALADHGNRGYAEVFIRKADRGERTVSSNSAPVFGGGVGY